MKRTTPDPTASNPSGNNPPSQANEDNEVHAQNEGNWYNPKMREKGGKVKPLSPEEMEARLFLTLASKSEIENKEIHIKIGGPDSSISVLPLDIMNRIASFIPANKAQSNFALTNRSNYLSLDIHHPLRRFPGLVDDMKRTCQGTKMTRLDLMKRFDDHIKTDGGYDNVLLTPLSPLSRLSIAIAMMEWAQNQTTKADKPACIKLAQERLLTEVTSLKNNPAIEPGELRYMLMTAIRTVLTAPAGKTNRTRSLVFTMEIGKQIMSVLKGDLLDEVTRREIFFEVLKANPNDDKNIDYLEKEASRWPLEDLAVALMYRPTPLLFHRLTELSPTERPAAVEKIIRTILTTRRVEFHSHYAKNIIQLCAMYLATLNHELTSETDSLINSFLDLFHHITDGPSPASDGQSSKKKKPFKINTIHTDYDTQKFLSGFESGDRLNGAKANEFLTLKFSYFHESPYVFKGYVYRRMMDWIKAIPDRELAAQMTSSLSTSFNVSVSSTPD
jgi:hypothetical protein